MVIQRLGLSTGTWSVVAGHIVFCSAYATLVLQSRFATLTGTYDEAAADLGAPPRRVFLKVLWPMMMPAVVIAALLSFTFSFDDVVSTVFLAGPETETLRSSSSVCRATARPRRSTRSPSPSCSSRSS
ncbi:ABC transporter permease subunit [Rhodococcus hoagii]|nr:ABC transporter permease subunit [Prescottella equi]